ncbi:MAG: 30S ribosomal protein S4 [Patescibacteria group bacterium]|nr:30S ribosomal protein S4 [Patescibacteria group bacterium]MBU1876854.1 30S ribosomal protein S4 [Patescibacteria group bacterium]
MTTEKCKICRRLGDKLFLKGERCLSPKCAMIRKPYPPGQKPKKRTGPLSVFGKELKEKQKLKNWYNLRERQFRNYVRGVLKKRGGTEDASTQLIQVLESRLDNVVLKLGFANSRTQARKLISHRHFLVNDKIVNCPSFSVKIGDKIKIRPVSLKKGMFKNISSTIKKQVAPSWLSLNINDFEGEVKSLPTFVEASSPVEVSAIFEFYSR